MLSNQMSHCICQCNCIRICFTVFAGKAHHLQFPLTGTACILADIDMNNTLTRTDGNKTDVCICNTVLQIRRGNRDNLGIIRNISP